MMMVGTLVNSAEAPTGLHRLIQPPFSYNYGVP